MHILCAAVIFLSFLLEVLSPLMVILKILLSYYEILFSEPPTFVKKMESKITWKQGIAARLQCTVKGSPELHSSWFLNDKELSDGEKYKISFKNGLAILEIINLLVSDSGNYTFEVSNESGSESCSTQISVKGLPLLHFALTVYCVNLQCRSSMQSNLHCYSQSPLPSVKNYKWSRQ